MYYGIILFGYAEKVVTGGIISILSFVVCCRFLYLPRSGLNTFCLCIHMSFLRFHFLLSLIAVLLGHKAANEPVLVPLFPHFNIDIFQSAVKIECSFS